MKIRSITCVVILLVVCSPVLAVEADRDLSVTHVGGHRLTDNRRVWLPHLGNRCWRRHEVFKECVGTHCEEGSCWKPTIGPRCFRNCKSGCFCRDGYYRNHIGKCVAWRTCLKELYPWAHASYPFDQNPRRPQMSPSYPM